MPVNDMNHSAFSIFLLFCKSPIQERDDLSPSASRIRGECRCAGAAGNALLHRPSYGLRIIRIGGHIGEIRRASLGTTSQFPEVGHDHRTGTVGLGGEIVSQALFLGPLGGGGVILCAAHRSSGFRFTLGTPEEG